MLGNIIKVTLTSYFDFTIQNGLANITKEAISLVVECI